MRRVVRTFAPILLVLALASPPAPASPTTPTFVLKWGSNGLQPTQFAGPGGIVADSLGNVYVVDSSFNRIQKFDALGNLLGYFGTLGTGGGQFYIPVGIAIDGAGNLYISELTNNRIQKVTSTGTPLAMWGSPGSGNGQFDGPRGLAVDGAGNLYVVDSNNHRIQKFDAAGNYLAQWGTPGSADGQFNYPTDVAVDRSGFVYVTDAYNSRVQKFTSAGVYVDQWGSAGNGAGEFNIPGALAIDPVGNVYVTDNGNHRIQKFTPGGAPLTQWGTVGSGDGQFNNPSAVTVDAEANVYVVDYGNFRVQKFSSAGASLSRWPPAYLRDLNGPESGGGFYAPTGVAAGLGGYLYVTTGHGFARVTSTSFVADVYGGFGTADGKFNGANSIATASTGDVYVSDAGNNRIQRFTLDGVFVAKWGTPGSAPGQFNDPVGVAVDATGYVYVADRANHRVQKFTSGGIYVTHWGSLGTGNGQFSNPFGVAVDRNGHVYVADTSNNRIQKFTGDGEYLTQWYAVGAGVATDAAGHVYVSDYFGATVQQFTSTGILLADLPLSAGTRPTNVGTDPWGSVYITDVNNFGTTGRVQKFVTRPLITFMTDVANDNGHRVKLRIRPTSGDAAGSGATVLGYDVYLRGEALAATPGPNALAGAGALPATAAYLITPTGAAEYVVEVGTVTDATAAALAHSAFMVRAWSGPYSYLDSDVEHGLSIDQLPPPVPSPFTATYESGTTHLHWNVSPAEDFTSFRLHRGTSPGFEPTPSNLVTATPDTGYADAGPAGSYYKLSAVDDDGNESAFATLGPEQTVDVPQPPAAGFAFALAPVWPNPASARGLTVRFTLPGAAPARLELVNVAGRRVVAREVGGLGVGTHAVDLSAGGRSLESGVYLVRLAQGTDVRVQRVVVLE